MEEVEIELVLAHFFGKAFDPILGIMPFLMALLVCAFYTPVIIIMLKSALRSDQPPA